jgi:hypothetical protein
MNNTWEGVELSRYDRQGLVMNLDDLLQQSQSGDLKDPFREPMGIAHSGWAAKVPSQEEKAEVAVEEEDGQGVGVELSSRQP